MPYASACAGVIAAGFVPIHTQFSCPACRRGRNAGAREVSLVPGLHYILHLMIVNS